MINTKLTLNKIRSRGLDAELLYGGLQLYKMAADAKGNACVRDLIRHMRSARVTHPCERALQVLADLVEPVLDGRGTWEEARAFLDKLVWDQNAN